jgi:nicotinamidase-related amidase
VPGGADVVPLAVALRDSGHFDLVVYTQDWHPRDHVSFSSVHPDVPVLTTIEVSLSSYSSDVPPHACSHELTHSLLFSSYRCPSGLSWWCLTTACRRPGARSSILTLASRRGTTAPVV